VRILLIAYSTYITDGRVKRHAEALVKRGCSVDVLCLVPKKKTELNGVNLVPVSMPRYRGPNRASYLRSYARFFAIASVKVLQLSLKHRYDLVIACSIPDAAVLCAIPAKLFGSKVILDVHDTMPELYQDKFGGKRGAIGARLLMLEEHASAWLADGVLAVHDLHARRLEQAGISPSKITVVMNAPDPAIFSPNPNGSSNRTGAPFTLICHGTLNRRLGLDVAIEAIDRLRDRLPDVRLRVLGVGDYKAEAQALATRLRLQQKVTFEDTIPIECLQPLLMQAQVGLVPNRASSATHLMLPVKLFEYATLGIPAIAARLRTIEHYFGDAVRYFEPGDAGTLAEAIAELYHDPGLRQEFAARASEVAERLSWRTQRERYYQAIDRVLEGQVHDPQ